MYFYIYIYMNIERERQTDRGEGCLEVMAGLGQIKGLAELALALFRSGVEPECLPVRGRRLIQLVKPLKRLYRGTSLMRNRLRRGTSLIRNRGLHGYLAHKKAPLQGHHRSLGREPERLPERCRRLIQLPQPLEWM